MVTEILPSNCLKQKIIISEVDTSVYYSTTCSDLSIKASTYKVNYKTGEARITSDSLPYFAMTISEDGQYVAGVYYTGGTAINDPYNEVIEVRKISDYSVVFRESKYWQDYDPNFAPYQWVTKYKFRFSKDNKFILLHKNYSYFSLYDISRKLLLIDNKNAEAFSCKSFSKDSKYLFYQCKIKNGKFENHIVNLESMVDRFIKNEPEFPILVGGSEGLILGDKFLLSAEGIATYDSTYTKLRLLGNIGLAKVNFDLNSILEPENPIQGILYPNPTNMNLTLKLQLNSPLKIITTLHNTEGSLMKDYGLKLCEEGENILYFNVSELAPGTYFLKLNGENFIQNYKVIINR